MLHGSVLLLRRIPLYLRRLCDLILGRANIEGASKQDGRLFETVVLITVRGILNQSLTAFEFE